METDATATTVRQGRSGDYPAVRTLLEASGLPLEGLDPALGSALVAHSGGRLVGCVALESFGEAALLRSLAVAPEARGQGLGERLTADILALAAGAGVRDVYLLTETAADYFPRFGFSPRDRASAPPALQASAEFRTACPASARMLHARLEA